MQRFERREGAYEHNGPKPLFPDLLRHNNLRLFIMIMNKSQIKLIIINLTGNYPIVERSLRFNRYFALFFLRLPVA